jgi:hypothetical protein
MLARLGLVGRIDAVGGLLEQKSHQCIGGLKDGIFGEFSGWDGAGGEGAFRVKAVGLG